MKLCSRSIKSVRRVNPSTPRALAADIELLCNQGNLPVALSSLATTEPLLHPHAFKCLLQCCASTKALQEGQLLHALILTYIPISIAPLESTLVYMYLQCDRIQDARHIFDRMAKWDVFVWNVMISAYTRHGEGYRAFQIFAAMEKASVLRDEITYVNILKTCKFLGDLAVGRRVHACLIKTTLKASTSVENSLLGVYAHHGSMEDALNVFKQMVSKDVVSWTLLIAGYVMNGDAKEALVAYMQMESTSILPDKVTFLTVLQACSILEDLATGKHAHGQVVLCGLDLETFMTSALVNLYSKCGRLDEAQTMFCANAANDLVSYNALIAGHANHGQVEDAFKVYGDIYLKSLMPDQVTFLNLINACSMLGDKEVCAEIHTHLVNDGFESDLQVMNSLLDMYAKCGCMDDACQVFSQFQERDVVSWTTIISGYARQGLLDKAMQLLHKMRTGGINPDKFTYVCVLKACVSLKSLEKGRLIHTYVVQSGLELDSFMESTLVDLYAKCGHLNDARHAFDSNNNHDVVSWTAMLVAYAKYGYGQDALELMAKMLDRGVKLNHVTLLGVLSACSHSGLLEEGHHVFNIMKQKGVVTKTAEHYACMIDLLTRAGCLEAAGQLLADLPFEPNVSMWLALLRSCVMCGNRELARHAAKHVLKLEPGNEAAFVLLSNVCANEDGDLISDVVHNDDWLSYDQLEAC